MQITTKHVEHIYDINNNNTINNTHTNNQTNTNNTHILTI